MINQVARGESKDQRSQDCPWQLIANRCVKRVSPRNICAADKVYSEDKGDQTPAGEREKPAVKQRANRSKETYHLVYQTKRQAVGSDFLKDARKSKLKDNVLCLFHAQSPTA